MSKSKMGLVGVCSHFESGGERHDELIISFEKAMNEAGIDTVIANRAVWDVTDALNVCDQFKEAGIESVAIVYVSWVCDSLSYIFSHELNIPIVFWAVPYPETFSIACIQEFGSALKNENIHFEYVYGLADNAQVIDKVRTVAAAGQIISSIKSMRICLLGPRQSWRVAGAQDMTTEEWRFSRTLGPTIVHVTIDELIAEAKKISEEDAKETLAALRSKTGVIIASEESMLWMAKIYMTTKKLIRDMRLDVLAAECYPAYGGLMNQTASWLADEDIICDTEGDIANAMVEKILNDAAGGGACVLGEICAYNDNEDYMLIAHAGSTSVSMAESPDKVVVNPEGDNGTFIGFPVKAMDTVTYCDMQGIDGKYQLMIAKGKTLPVSYDEWTNAGSRLVLKLRDEKEKSSKVIDRMIKEGLHHHVIVKEGDYTELIAMICRYMGIRTVEI